MAAINRPLPASFAFFSHRVEFNAKDSVMTYLSTHSTKLTTIGLELGVVAMGSSVRSLGADSSSENHGEERK
jgi:hypothetical protein